MTKGGFTAAVKIIRFDLCGGVSGEGRFFTRGEMELDGSLTELHYGDFKGALPPGTKSKVFIRIEFIDFYEVPLRILGPLPEESEEEPARPYLGTLRFEDPRTRTMTEEPPLRDMDLWAGFDIVLPLSMAHSLVLMEGKPILFDSIHDLITNPTEEQKVDRVVAFVKRVYFSIRARQETT